MTSFLAGPGVAYTVSQAETAITNETFAVANYRLVDSSTNINNKATNSTAITNAKSVSINDGASANLTVATILSHQGGISGIEESNMKLEPNDWYDHAKICRAIENQAPLFEPRTANGYHAYIIGFLFAATLQTSFPN